jgi:hypothetical protein
MISLKECRIFLKKCTDCGKLKVNSKFSKNKYKNKIYLRKECKECQRKKLKNYKHICKECGKEFVSKNKTQDYCSRECTNQVFKRKGKLFLNGQICRIFMKRCQECGKMKMFIKFPKTRGSYFNRENKCNQCKRGLVKRTEKICVFCNNKFLTSRKVNFCSQECFHMYNSKENHWRYNHNLTDEEREMGRLIEGYNDFVKDVFKRDKYKCQHCGSNKKINAHHLNSYNWDKEHRVDVNNGVTLCEDCHKLFHKTYGYGDNTEEQFKLFNNMPIPR